MRVLASTIVLALSAGCLSACQNTSASGGGGSGTGAGGPGSGGSGGGGSISSFSPDGCGFTIAPRPEYLGFVAATAVVKGDPHIRRVRLGLGGDVTPGSNAHADPATSIAFAWQTDDGTFASDVAWGKDPDPSKWSASDRTSGVTWATPQGELNGMGDERMHEAYVCGLSPDTTYYYRVGGGAKGSEIWSDVYAFTTAPPAGQGTVKVAITGDSRGEQMNAWQILEGRVKGAGAALQLFSGDMINLAPDQGEWEQWLDAGWKDTKGDPSTLPEILTLSAHGNHDNHTSLFFGNLVLPQEPKTYPKYGELFFSVDFGPLHVLVIDDAWVVDPTGDSSYAGTLSKWLDADLTAAQKNRAKVPWILAMHHHPEYSSSTHGMDADVLRGRQFFEPIWEKYHVDLALAGHDHDYERSKPLTGPVDAPTTHTDPKDGTIYLVCAGSGADPYGSGTSTFTATSHDFTGGGAIGLYSIVTASATQLKLEAHELRGDASDPIFDTITLTH